MEQKTENKRTENFSPDFLKSIVALVTIFISLNFFYSYRLLKGILSHYKLDLSAVLVKEDFMFSFGHLNFTIITLSLLGFVWIYIWQFFEDINKEKASKDLDGTLTKILEFTNNHKKISLGVIIVISTSLLFYLIWYYFIEGEKFPSSISVVYFIILCVFPILYNLHINKRKLIMIGYLVTIFLWGNGFISEAVKTYPKEASTSPSDKAELIIEKNGKNLIIPSDSLSLVYHGYKYIILADKKYRHTLIPTDQIGIISKKIEKPITEEQTK